MRHQPEAEPEWQVSRAILAIARRLPVYLKLAWELVRDPRVPASARRWIVGAGLYNLSPIEPIPGIIPVLGQCDDYAVLLLAIRNALRASPQPVREELLKRAGTNLTEVDHDLKELRRIAGHIAQRAAWGVWAGLKFATGVGLELGRQLLIITGRALHSVRSPGD